MEVSIRNLENQMGQLANGINNQPQGTLPSDTEINPKREGKEHCNAIALRSEKELTEVAGRTPKQSNADDTEGKKIKDSKNVEHEKKEEDPVACSN